MITKLLVPIMAGLAAVGFVAWRVSVMHSQEPLHQVIVYDPSLSHSGGCESLVGLTEQALGVARSYPESTLGILVLGRKATASEPWLLAQFTLAAPRRVLEGRNAEAQREEKVILGVRKQCQEKATPTMQSPILLGVKEAIAELRGQGCNEKSHCMLYVDTDGEENVESALRRALNAGGPLPTPNLNNAGMNITFCDMAVTAGVLAEPSGKAIRTVPSREARREDRKQEAWRSIFSDQDLVRFEPYCPLPKQSLAAAKVAAKP